MKKIILSVSLLLLGNAYSQEANFNKLAIDANVGLSNAMNPRFTKGFGENDAFGRFKDFTINVGGRYNLSNMFGAGLYLGYSKIGNTKDDNSSSFITVSTQGIFNLSNVLGFDKVLNNKFRLLFHAGPGLGFLTNSKLDGTDKMLTLTAGFTPQYKINDKLRLTFCQCHQVLN